MAPESQNLEVVRELYRCFRGGDITGVLALLSEDISWENPGDDDAYPSFFGVRHGKAAVAEVFAFIRANFAISLFDVRRLLAQDDTVIAVLRIERTVTPTGRLLAQEVIHRWTLSERRITGFHDYHDSHGIAAALRP